MEKKCEMCKYRRGTDCRYKPPVVMIDKEGNIFSEWPTVYADEWCGQFQPKN